LYGIKYSDKLNKLNDQHLLNGSSTFYRYNMTNKWFVM